ncbi:MAG: phosphatase PAP2 family protein [Ferruginibacter sp.]|nr:phosphatase PAP2 family protein [Ferruginibacter sp.]
MQTRDPRLFSINNILLSLALSLGYLLFSFFLIGFKTDQLFLVGLFNGCFFSSTISRKFITGFAIFIVYWILFDYMKAFPNYTVNEVRIGELYQAEKQLFGFNYAGNVVTPNEYWLLNGTTFLDVLSGLFYLCWIPVPLAFAAYLFFVDKKIFLHFALTFVLVNLLGFVIYYVYPAAPPWYYQLHGTEFIQGTNGNTAGLHKFDEYFNTGVFKSLYEKSSNVFAAMPSLHSSYPLIVLYYAMQKKLGWMNWVFFIVAAGIWFAAVYTSHHYIIDVLAGIACAVSGIALFQLVLLKLPPFKRFIDRYLTKI